MDRMTCLGISVAHGKHLGCLRRRGERKKPSGHVNRMVPNHFRSHTKLEAYHIEMSLTAIAVLHHLESLQLCGLEDNLSTRYESPP